MQPATKRATPKKPTTTTPVRQTKPAPPPPSKKPSKQKGEGDNADLERAIKLSLDPAFLPQGRAPVGGVTIRDPVSEATPKLHEVVGKGKAVVTEEQINREILCDAWPRGSVKNQETEKSPKEDHQSQKGTRIDKQDSLTPINEERHGKELQTNVKDHKRKHDSDDDEDDDDDEGPSAGSNQGRSTKRRRSDSAASGSAKPPPKADDQKFKETKESDPESEHSEQSSDDISKQDEGNDSDMEDTDNAHIPKVRTGKKKLCKADLEGPAFNLVKAFHKNSVFLQYQMDECHKLLTNKVDLSNPEGHQILRNIYEPLPLGGPPGDKERKIALSISKLKAARYLDFGLEELVPSLWVESEREYDIRRFMATLTMVLGWKEIYINKHRESSDGSSRSPCEFSVYSGLKVIKQRFNLERPIGIAADYYFKEDYTIVPKPRAVVYRDRNDQRKLMRLNELHKFSDGNVDKSHGKARPNGYRLSSVTDTYPILLSFTHYGNKSILRVLRIIIVILPEHPSETMVFHNEDGNPARANIKQALVMPSDIQHSAATQIWGCYRLVSESSSHVSCIIRGYLHFRLHRLEPGRPVAPPSSDYIPDSEEPQTLPVPQDEDKHEPMFIQPHEPDYVPEPIYPKYIPLEDEHEFSVEEQPLPPIDSPTVESPGYVTESDPEEDPEEYEDDETKDGPVDYPMDGEKDGDDDDGDSSGDDTDDEDGEDEEDDDEEENLAPADSAIIVPTIELASISLPPKADVEKLLAMPTPPPSPLTSLSPPSAGEHLARCTAPSPHSSPPSVPSPLLTLSGCPTQIQTLRISSTQALVDAVTAALSSPPIPPLLPSLYIPPPIDRRDDVLESEQPPRKRSCLFALGSRFPEDSPMTVGEVNTRVTELAELHEHDTHDLYALLEDAQDSRTRIA
ncbi:hypothetical protein Tco_1515144 [Tanacetum coccineum]